MTYISGECTLDANNCSSGKICYGEVSWADEVNFCGCLPQSGWTGDDCTGFSPGFVVAKLFEWVMMAAALLVLVVGVPKDLKAVKYSFKEFRKWKSLAENWVYSVIFFASIFGTLLVKNIIYFNPSTIGHDNLPYDNLKTNGNPLAIAYQVFNLSFIFFGTLAFFNISLTWVEHARRLQLFILYDDKFTELRKFRYAIRLVAVIALTVTALIAAGVRSAFSSISIVLVVNIAIMSSYCYGQNKLTTILIQTNSNLQNTFYYKRVRRTYYLVVGSLILEIFGAMLISLDYNDFYDHPTKFPPDHVPVHEIGLDILTFGIVTGQGTVYLYLRRIFDGPSEQEKEEFFTIVRTVDSSSFNVKGIKPKRNLMTFSIGTSRSRANTNITVKSGLVEVRARKLEADKDADEDNHFI